MHESCPVRMCVAQLHGSAVTRDAQSGNYRVGHEQFNRVRVLGLCTQHIGTELRIDDGTGLLNVKMMPSVLKLVEQELQPGELVDCVGSIEDPWPSSDSTRNRRLLNATHVRVVKDLNTETLRMLDILHLYKSCYAIPGSSPAGRLELLAFPPLAVTESARQTVAVSGASPVQHGACADAKSQPRTGTVIEKPRQQSANGVSQYEAAVPPAEYQLVAPGEDHHLIEQGRKSLMIRLNTPPYSIIHENDRIIINEKIPTTVVAVRKYAQLESVLQAENIDALLPERTRSMSASATVLRQYRQFFSKDEEKHAGLVVFQLAVASPSMPKSQAEWSQLILQRLGTKSEIGYSVADLQFAFPSLPVEQIKEILVNLELDGMAFHVNDRYRSV